MLPEVAGTVPYEKRQKIENSRVTDGPKGDLRAKLFYESNQNNSGSKLFSSGLKFSFVFVFSLASSSLPLVKLC